MFEPDPCRFTRAQAGCPESLNALLRQRKASASRRAPASHRGVPPLKSCCRPGAKGCGGRSWGFDPQHGTRFATYAWPCIVRAIWRAARTRPAPPLGLPPDRQATTDPAQLYAERQVQAALHALVRRLPSRLRYIITRRYGLDGQPPATYAYLGRQLGLTRERVRQLHRRRSCGCNTRPMPSSYAVCLTVQSTSEYAAAAARRAQWRARGGGGAMAEHLPPPRPANSTQSSGPAGFHGVAVALAPGLADAAHDLPPPPSAAIARTMPIWGQRT